MNDLVTLHIVVLNYETGSVEFYHADFSADYQSEDVEAWLIDNTDYRASACYFMYSTNLIPIKVRDEVEYV